MPGFQEVNADLDRLGREIETKTHDLESAREEYLTAKAGYENTLARAMMEIKAQKPTATQTDIKAEATSRAYEAKMKLIRTECTYKRLSNEIRASRDRLEAARELSFNLRRESKI